MNTILSFFTKNQKRTRILAYIWITFILFACFLPGSEVPKVKLFQADKLVHFALFGGCSFLIAVGFWKHGSRKILIKSLLFSILLGILVELIQSTSLTSGRSGDVWDAVADSIGAFLGVLLVKLWVLPKLKKGAFLN